MDGWREMTAAAKAAAMRTFEGGADAPADFVEFLASRDIDEASVRRHLTDLATDGKFVGSQGETFYAAGKAADGPEGVAAVAERAIEAANADADPDVADGGMEHPKHATERGHRHGKAKH